VGKKTGGGIRLSTISNIHPYETVGSKFGSYEVKYLYAIGKCPTLLAQIKNGEINYKDILYINNCIMFVNSCENWEKQKFTNNDNG